MMLGLGNALSLGSDEIVGLCRVETQDTRHLYLHKAQYVVGRNLADKLGLEGVEPVIYMGYGLFHRTALLELAVLIDALLYKYLLQRSKEQRLLQLSQLYLQLLPEQVAGRLYAAPQHLTHREEVGLLVVDDATVGRDAYLAVGKGIQGIYRLV